MDAQPLLEPDPEFRSEAAAATAGHGGASAGAGQSAITENVGGQAADLMQTSVVSM